MSLTYSAFTTMLAGLNVAGVTKHFSQAPSQLSTAQLPAMWPRLPSGKTEVATLNGETGWDVLTCDLLVAVEAESQGTQPQNWQRSISIVDALQVALKAEAATHERIVDSWVIRLSQDQIGDTVYWVIVATVTGSS